ncbi:hypothetical protein M405DRAFT_874596 [Rhizopogon salebrosus TDB-379]|nr:hypothetical protein M405DRAFT_874596 [Rhizopogon salebrosus TDB-379]
MASPYVDQNHVNYTLNRFRPAKSGSDWTTDDLLAYNIKVPFQPPDMFYGQPLPIVASLSSLDSLVPPYLDLKSKVNSGQESAIDCFVKEILRVLGYEKRGLFLRSCYALLLLISGGLNRSAQTGDKTTVSACNPEPQRPSRLFSAIIARLSEPEFDSMTIPWIVMIDTRRANCRLNEGMEPPSFRQLALQHYTAFRTLSQKPIGRPLYVATRNCTRWDTMSHII